MSTWMTMYVDATEVSEVSVYLFDASDAPGHMRRRMRESETKKFENINEEFLDGLVDEEHDDAEDRAEEVITYLEEKAREGNLFKPGPGVRVAYFISRSAS